MCICVILFYYFMALWKTCQWLINGILWRDICALCTLHNWRLSQASDSLQYTAVLDSCPLIYSMSQKVHNLQINIVCPSTFSYLANNYVCTNWVNVHTDSRFTSSPDHRVCVSDYTLSFMIIFSYNKMKWTCRVTMVVCLFVYLYNRSKWPKFVLTTLMHIHHMKKTE